MSTTLVVDFCPYCGAKFEAATQVGGDRAGPPAAGDVTCCAYCYKLAIYENGGISRKMTDEEFNSLDPEIKTIFERTSALLKARALKKKDIKEKA